jgi:ATP-binding cassette, subfamily B (MDR/TAP), member 1
MLTVLRLADFSSLAFSFGTTLIRSHHGTAGEVVTVILSILVGSFSLAMLAPEMQGVDQTRLV